MKFLTGTLMAAMLVIPGAAFALGDCPAQYSDDDCIIPGQPAAVCWLSSGVYTCVAFNSSDETIYAITDNGETWAWGVARGNEFCCYYNGVYPIYIDMQEGDDEVYLNYETDLDQYTYEETSEILGGDGDDWIEGSYYSNCSFPCDKIYPGYGDTDGDYVFAFDGSDEIDDPMFDTVGNHFWGGDGDDKIRGGNNTDYIYGEGGDDVLSGRGGTDYIWGGLQNDWINGHGGRDTLYGGLGTDTVCGGADEDTVDGGWGFWNDTCADSGDTRTNCYAPYYTDTCPDVPW